MSSQQPSNENLSAYFDHEVSPEERRQLESLLENSTEARQELHETGELSRLLQETATESAPPELAPSIRRRIEQETLLTQTSSPVVKRAPSVLRYRIALAISTCSSLAALVLFVLLMNTYVTPNQSKLNQGFAVSQPTHPSSSMDTSVKTIELAKIESINPTASVDLDAQNEKVTALLASPTADNNATSPTVNNGNVARWSLKADQKQLEENTLNAPIASKPFGKFSVMNTLTDGIKVDNRSSKLRRSAQTPSQGIPAHIPLDTIRIGDVLPYFGDIDGKVAVIEVRVVDVQEALGTMELLLARNNIPINQKKQSEVERQLQNPQSGSKSELKAKGQSLAQKENDAEKELFAVYVEATDKQLSATLQEFQNDLKRDQLVSLSLQPAINERSLTEEIKELPKLLAYKTPQSKHDAYSVAKNEAKKPTYTEKTSGAPKGNRSSTNTAKLKKMIADSKTSKDLKRDLSRSFQTRYRMQMPAEALVRSKAPKQEAEMLLGSSVKTLPSPESPLSASKPALGQVTSMLNGGAKTRSFALSESRGLNETSPPIKVLFVFKNSAATPTSAAPH